MCITAYINGVICSATINCGRSANSLNINDIGIRVAIDRSNTVSGLHSDDICTAITVNIGVIGMSILNGKHILPFTQIDIEIFLPVIVDAILTMGERCSTG